MAQSGLMEMFLTVCGFGWLTIYDSLIFFCDNISYSKQSAEIGTVTNSQLYKLSLL